MGVGRTGNPITLFTYKEMFRKPQDGPWSPWLYEVNLVSSLSFSEAMKHGGLG